MSKVSDTKRASNIKKGHRTRAKLAKLRASYKAAASEQEKEKIVARAMVVSSHMSRFDFLYPLGVVKAPEKKERKTTALAATHGAHPTKTPKEDKKSAAAK